MAELITNLNTPYLKALFYGNPGTTKTRTMCTATLDNRTYPTLYLNIGGNPESIKDYERLPLIINVSELKDFNAPYDFLVKGQLENHPFYKTYVKDSHITEPFKSVIVDCVTDVQNKGFIQVQHGLTLLPGTIPSKREWEHYNKILYFTTNFADRYYSLPMHVLMSAWEKSLDKERYPDSPNVVPMLEGDGRKILPGKALLVCRLMSKGSLQTHLLNALIKANIEPKYSIGFFSDTKNFLAKNQYGGNLPAYLVDPTITQILDYIYE